MMMVKCRWHGWQPAARGEPTLGCGPCLRWKRIGTTLWVLLLILFFSGGLGWLLSGVTPGLALAVYIAAGTFWIWALPFYWWRQQRS
jgi:hypothetical protein